MLVCPTFADAQFTLTLNGMTYEPSYSPRLVDEHLYISLEDLSAMTYSNYSQDEKGYYTLSLQSTTLTFSANSKNIKINGKQTIFTEATSLVNDVLYVPITYLDIAQYTYSLSKDKTKLSINAMIPYSSTTDTYNLHKTIPSAHRYFSDVFKGLLEDKEATTLVNEAIKNNQYLSFASTSYKAELIKGMKDVLTSSPEMEVTFRQLDLMTPTPSCKNLTSYPLKLSVQSDGINLKFNDKQLSYTCVWPTYNPSTHYTDIDINKSLDVMVMRALYEYYRDTYDLKDDIHFSPVTIVQMGRSDGIKYTVYSDHLVDATHTYKVVLYKKVTPNKVNYIVDLISTT